MLFDYDDLWRDGGEDIYYNAEYLEIPLRANNIIELKSSIFRQV